MYLGGICLLTDRKRCAVPVLDAARLALEAGVRFIQYREKELTRREIFGQAARLRELTLRFGASLIVNDHADIALAIDADGVHLGQDDLPLAVARRIMGGRIIGISTHSLVQAKAAAEGGADYIGFGPIFETSTKDAGTAVGVDNLRLITQNVSVPVVAIGGIGLGNIEAVFAAGAEAVAMASALCAGDVAGNAERFIRLLGGKDLVS